MRQRDEVAILAEVVDDRKDDCLALHLRQCLNEVNATSAQTLEGMGSGWSSPAGLKWSDLYLWQVLRAFTNSCTK
jgi:hypothetical protein